MFFHGSPSGAFLFGKPGNMNNGSDIRHICPNIMAYLE
ncbi:hypothetical protein LptCag_0213 [Leptospirillum ferriphilum]|uniref:Uncharacterized protein n=1 Tax=Leptospirillum ferriphilum TaxID=178606 RepID=A0A094WAU2_9BACT|nr:hypothetical protein LptCag_0213 [Leptospirillum ferriphilum]